MTARRNLVRGSFTDARHEIRAPKINAAPFDASTKAPIRSGDCGDYGMIGTACSVHCAMWLEVSRAWNGRQKAA